MNVITEDSKIEEILTRGVADVLPSKQEVKDKLRSGERLRIFFGADPTGVDLHIGHSKAVIMLERLRRLGHEIIFLFGDFTAMIGDPTDRAAARVRLSKDEVEENIKTWKDQIAPILSFDDPDNPAVIRKNNEWLSTLRFDEVIDIASHFTVQRMLERDMFERRMKDSKPVWLHEFFYPLMQGYDSVAMDVDGEIGGTDQTFNMLAGRSLQQAYNKKDKFVITVTMLANPVTGEKMSKSKGNYVSLQAKSTDMYGEVMALPDAMILQMFTDCTFLPLDEVASIEHSLTEGKNPRDVKMRLAREIVSMYHGEEAANNAEKEFVNTFQKGGLPEDLPEIVVDPAMPVCQMLVESGLVESRSACRRLIEQGAVRHYETGQKIDDPETSLTEETILKVGKRQFVRISFVSDGKTG